VLEFVDASGVMTFVDTSASTVDLGYDTLGRSGIVKASGSTPVTFNLTGLSAWNASVDQIQITASNADVWDFLVPNPALAAGATTASVVEDWFASNAAGSPLSLLAAADSLLVHQLATSSFTIGATTYTYQAASNATSPALGGIALTDRVAAAIPAPLASSPLTGTITVNWSLSQFEAFLPLMNPAATTDTSAHSLVVGANAFPLTAAGPVAHGTPILFALRVPALTGDLSYPLPLTYGQFLPTALWNEWRGVDLSAHVSYVAPGASTALDQTVSVGRREPMSPAPATTILPTLAPVQTPLVNGSGAFATLPSVGLTPTISWTAPTTGSPSSYTVEIFWLHAVGGASVGTPVARWTTASTQISLPPGVLASLNTYYARLTANAIAGDPYATAPFRRLNVSSYASTLTGTFSP
jgi:hypothetical protein